ncbi:hypothetical protein N0V93_000728 [Gnomoniopsis smithogilvyi]|uniref:Uncharacterized protein n=1 Tax=Gnomoniopsis smithogilvyi TaxID=1191159 RepID=A0A9W8Z478_9PEZI|nr:hypothetical protein N0V93_000728 [Gnomoniopsis smithogilvyi]
MKISKQRQEGALVKARPSRPNLTLDTQPPLRPLANDTCARSAPVGTRQDKGFAPMYQAGDIHCAKLAEMMNSPTWRSQNPAAYIGHTYVQHPPPSSEETPQTVSYHKEHVTQSSRTTGLAKQDSHYSCSTGEVLRLGRRGDDIEILGIQSFLESPESSNNTFIISAAISQQGLRPHEAFPDNLSSQHGHSPHSLSLSTISPRQNETVRQEMGLKLEDSVQKIMEQDDAIQSINNSLRSPNRRRQATSDEQQRFRGLLDRLHQRSQEGNCNQSQAASFVDPAIIAYIPKQASPGTPTKRTTRHRSDSGYASPSIYSRPSTRTQSRTGRESSDCADLDIIRVEHQKGGSHDSGFDESPSKNSVLNPTAKEFSFSSASNTSPVKKFPFIPKHVPKPKVPNTTGQQNWELMHELRRMNEPGYAQRCKEKQKKRFMKQLEKTVGQP